MEIWKKIKNFEKYSISNLGNIKAINKKGKEYFISITNNGNGYERVYLYKNGTRTKYFIHRLVAEAFLINPDPLKNTQVHHKDHVRNNNTILNLIWCTPKENVRYMIEHNKRYLS